MATILIIDDNERIFLLLEKQITKYFPGSNVYIARDGKQALKLFYKKQPDIILLDINIPKKNGYEVCEEIRLNDTQRYVKIIMYSVEDVKKVRPKALRAGADVFLEMPFDIDSMIAQIESLLRLKETERERTITRELRLKASTADHLLRVVAGFYHEMAPWLSPSIVWTKKLIDSCSNCKCFNCKVQLNDKCIQDCVNRQSYMKKIEKGVITANNLMKVLSSNVQRLQSYDIRKVNIGDFLDAWKEIVLSNQDVKSRLRRDQIKIFIKDNLDVNVSGIILSQVLVNLLRNALQHSTADENILIKIEASKLNIDSVIVSFTDNGCGIPPQDHEQIFEFGVSTKRDNENNQGMGLYNCREYLAKMDSSIQLDTEFIDGARFFIYLPIFKS